MRMNADVVVDAVHRARRKSDDLIGRGAISREVTHDVAGCLDAQRARRARPHLAARQKRRAPRLDAGNGVRLLHADVELVTRPAQRAQAGNGHREGVLASRHTPSLRARGRRAWTFLALFVEFPAKNRQGGALLAGYIRAMHENKVALVTG